MLNFNNYTVGWICAISIKYIAVQSFFNNKYNKPNYISLVDNNNYILGRMGRYNIIITILPKGEYGITSIVIIVKDMLYSFPNIRIGLMVGISNSVLSLRHDICLEDIIVSTPFSKKGGIF